MRERMALAAIAAGIGCVSGSACAMNSSERHPSPSCQVIDGNKLPAESGGADALCREIAAATAEAAPGIGYRIEIRVLPRSRLSATVTTADGRRLPELGMASMDKPLTAGSFKRFAASIAEELARAAAAKS
jgi:hypothetical protein